MMQALGLIEVLGYPTAIAAADAALKAADVQLSSVSKVDGGIMTVQLFGDVGAITSAVEAGGRAAEKVGTVRCTHVIPRVDESLIGTIIKKREIPSQTVEAHQTSQSELEVPVAEEISMLPPLTLTEDSVTESEEDNQEVTPAEDVINIDDLSKKNNAELREIIQALGINTISNKKLREAKKAELIRIITEFYK